MSDHTIHYFSGGTGIEGWIMPVCRCGWKGTKHFAHNDYQHTNAREQAERHLDKSARATESGRRQ